jgi:hypothetical protein
MTRAGTVPPIASPGAVAGLRFGRSSTQADRSESAPQASPEDGRQAWQALASWLQAGRVERGLAIADIARITKIQARILHDMEAGDPSGLPADVFVRGFIRSFARCVGLSEAEAAARYAACSRDAGPVTSAAATAVAGLYAPPRSRMATVVPVQTHAATVPAVSTSPAPYVRSTMPMRVPLARASTQHAVERGPSRDDSLTAKLFDPTTVVPVPVPAPAPAEVNASQRETGDAKKRRDRKRREQRSLRSFAETERPELLQPDLRSDPASAAATVITPRDPSSDPRTEQRQAEVLAAPVTGPEPDRDVFAGWPQSSRAAVDVVTEPLEAAGESSSSSAAPAQEAVWIPTMPPPARPARRAVVRLATVTPTLVIDDADPESASSQQDDRRADPSRRTFLPPILLESHDRANRQGGLTLAVIILLIAATLTLSYLMRRPSSTGSGMTSLDHPALRIG